MAYLNGVNGLCLTKIDVLDGLDKIKICVDYSSAKKKEYILETMSLEEIKPKYVELSGWKESTYQIQKFHELNQGAKNFIDKVEEISGIPVVMVSTGPKREDIIVREYPLNL